MSITSTSINAAMSEADTGDDTAPAARNYLSEAALRRDDFDRDVWCLLGLPVDISDIDRAVSAIEAAVRSGEKLSFVTPNVNWLVRALREPQARREILNADLSVADGAPLIVMAKILGVPLTSRVAGADIFEALNRRPGYSGRRLKVFFFGGRDGAAEAASAALNKEAGGLESAGWLNPGFGDLDTMSAPEIIDEINAANPDFVVVALGAAKGQAWIERNKDHLKAPVIAHLGAVVDFTAGGIARAPDLVKKLGMEWAWRIKEEPALWRRYFDDGVALTSVALKRLAPQGLGSIRRRQGAESAGADLSKNAGLVKIKLHGDLTAGNLGRIRETFRSASRLSADVELDFSNVNDFDRSFLGLVLMLEKHIANSGRTIYVSGATPPRLRLLRNNAMVYGAPPSAGRGFTTDYQAAV